MRTRRCALTFVGLLFPAMILFSSCGGRGVSNSSTPNSGGTAAANSVSLSVGPGPSDMTNPAGGFANILFATVSVCQPGTSNCANIDHVLVDTGSSGLRLLASELPGSLALPGAKSGSNSLYECLPFVDSYTWGNVVMVDLELAGEKASSLPVQLINNAAAPTTCSGTVAVSGSSQVATVNDLGAKGILGVGNFGADCGTYCTSVAKFDLYFACSSTSATSCTQTGVPVAQQVPNPVQMFTGDNNGVAIQMASVSTGGAASATGTLFFGVGTQADNTPSAAVKVLGLNDVGNFGTTFQSVSYPNSFADTGSNSLFFGTYDATAKKASTGIPACNLGTTANPAYFYCPTSELSETATMTSGSASAAVSFNVGNVNNLNGYALSDLGATNSDGTSFDWGLPFFYGRTVYVGLEGSKSSVGSGKYIAF